MKERKSTALDALVIGRNGLLMGMILMCAARVLGATATAPSDLVAGFAQPPDSARPRVYWFWLGGSISREGITADLEAMKRAGIGGALMFNAYPSTPPVSLDCMSPEWWGMLEFAAGEAGRLGLEMGTHNCPGWSTSGGPWITPAQSMQKVVWSETRTNGPGQLTLSLPRPQIDPKWNYYEDITVLAVRGAQTGVIERDGVFDLSRKMAPDGRCEWDAPAGAWTILRFGHATTGRMNGPPPTKGQGLECDKMSREAVEAHFKGYVAKIIDRLGPLAGKSFTHFEIDSYEAGPQNWTLRYQGEFARRRGYDPLPWLPVLAGWTLESKEKTGRFQWDMARTIAELYADNFYRPMAEMTRARGLRMDNEPYGGPFDSLTVGGTADMPMGECWTSDWGWNTLGPVTAAAHTYGKRLAGAEALTAQPIHGKWKQDPFSLKPYADQAFCLGINMLVLHCYAHQPWLDVTPGMTMNFWGTHFSRTQTWWAQSRPWFDYLARCQYLLQQGLYVADICRLGGAAGVVEGYKADACSEELMLTRMVVKDGRIVLPDGMSYRLLMLPKDAAMTPAVLRGVKRLVEAGATVLGPKPTKSPSLENYPDGDRAVQELAAELWGDCDGKAITEHVLGKGRVIWGKPASQVLVEAGVMRDFECAPNPDNAILSIHRTTRDTEIYFVSNQDPRPKDIQGVFRVSGKIPMLWHPDTGRMEPAPIYSEQGGRIRLPLHFDPCGSVFVIFCNDGARAGHLIAARRAGSAAASPAFELAAAQSGKLALRAWEPGTFEFKTAAGAALTSEVKACAEPVQISGPWDLRFPKGLGAPEKTALDKLISWPDHPESGVKYFSGTATYRTTFTVPKGLIRRDRVQVLDLGRVKNLAEVRLNGHGLGILWKPPFQVEVTSALKTGQNDLEIKVTNLWPNRMIGDEQEPDDCQWSDEVVWQHSKPPEKVGRALRVVPAWVIEHQPRPSKGRYTFSTWKFFNKDSPLLESGLLGPVVVQTAEEVALNLDTK
jgi:hypothetical protein